METQPTVSDTVQWANALPARANIGYEEGIASRTVVRPHVHPFWEFVFVCRCEGVTEELQVHSYRLQGKDFLIIPPRTKHSFHVDGTTGADRLLFERYVLWVDDNFLKNKSQEYAELIHLYRHAELGGSVVHVPSNVATALQSKWNEIWNEKLRKRYAWSSAVEIGAIDILFRVSRMLYYLKDSQWAAMEQRSLLDDVSDYIVAHMDEKLTLDGVAAHFYVTKSTILRIFRENLSISFYQYVIQRRLTRASNLMVEGLPLNDICRICGFGDYSSFYRACIKAYGVSPNDLCAQIKAEKSKRTTEN